MERLTDYSDDECTYIIGVGNETCEEFCKNAVDGCKNCYIQQVFKKLADYEDLEEQGLLVRLPCKVGDTVYTITRFCSGGIRDCDYAYECSECPNYKPEIDYKRFKITMLNSVGETVFLTREGAEKKLEEFKNKI